LFFSRLITGTGAATWLAFPLYFTAYYPPEGSGKAIGIINFVRSIALITATAAGGFIAEGFGITQPFFLAAALGIFALAGLMLTGVARMQRESTVNNHGTLHIATRPLLLIVSLMGILLHFAIFTGVFGFIPIYAAGIGASEGELGLITMVNLGFSALGALAAIWIWQKIGYRQTIFWSALLMSISIFVIPFTDTFFTLMAAQVPNGLGNGVIMTLFMLLSIHEVPREQQATTMGVFQAVYAIGMLAGPLTSGFLSNSLSLSSVFYLASALVLLIALLAFLPVFPGHIKNRNTASRANRS
jgi:predicted MFS family arabinose efflux permease